MQESIVIIMHRNIFFFTVSWIYMHRPTYQWSMHQGRQHWYGWYSYGRSNWFLRRNLGF